MADRVMTAEARITARDATGNVFPEIARKIDRLVAAGKRVDGIGRNIGAMQTRVGAIGRGIDATAHAASKVIAAGAAVGAAHAALRVAEKSIETFGTFDDLMRKQTKVADLNAEEVRSRRAQALHIGQMSRFSDVQVAEAQTTLAQRGVKKEFVEPFVKQLVDYAQAMDTTLPEAAKSLETIILSTNQNIENATTAAETMKKSIDLAVKMAKIGGLDSEGVQQAFKFGGASAHVVGLSNPYMSAIFASMHRAGISPEEAGVAVRSLSSKLVSPTKQGLDALAAMGIDYDQYTHMPGGGLNTANLLGMVKRHFGKKLNASQIERLDTALTDSDVVTSREDFIMQVSSIVGESFGKNKKGQLYAKDAAAIAKSVADFYKLSVESVDSERLFSDILKKHPTLGQLRPLFTMQHAGKIATLAQNQEMFFGNIQQLQHVQEGFAKDIGDYRIAGVKGAMQKASGAVTVAETRIGEANAGAIIAGADALRGLLTGFSDLSDRSIQATTAITGLVVGIGSIAGAIKLLGLGSFTGAVGAMSRFGIYGAAAGAAIYGANTVGGAIAGAGEIAAGKYYTPQNKEAVDDLKVRLAEVEGQIGHVKATTKGNFYNPVLAPLESEASQLRNRIGAGEVRLKGSAEVSGEVKITVDVNASPELKAGLNAASAASAKVSGTLNANGPGSTGRSSPDASAGDYISPHGH